MTVCVNVCAKVQKREKSQKYLCNSKLFCNFATNYQRILQLRTATHIYYTDEPICTYISLAAYKLRIRLAMRQCILWYVLLLLLYSWVMPDTLHRKSISSIFFVYSPPSDDCEAVKAHRRVSGGQSRSKYAARVCKANIGIIVRT